MKNFQSELLRQKSIAQDYMEMEFIWPDECETPRPGQFLTIRVHQNPVPLLRRPFALSSFNKESGTAAIIYQVRGRGTRIMESLSPGAPLDILSPLGNSFSLPEKDESPILVAGGIGLGPILYFARELDKAGMAPLLVFGTRDQSLIPDLPPLKNGRIQFCTDNGTAGFKGTSVAYLESPDFDTISNPRLYSCGPTGMLKACHDFAVKKEIPCETAMEEMMACGVGACMGCVVELDGKEQKYARVCKDGPVFQSRDIKWI